MKTKCVLGASLDASLRRTGIYKLSAVSTVASTDVRTQRTAIAPKFLLKLFANDGISITISLVPVVNI
jgi:hypothetical protein